MSLSAKESSINNAREKWLIFQSLQIEITPSPLWMVDVQTSV